MKKRMKKLLFFAVLAVCGLMFVSCGKETPGKVQEKALKCIQQKDWDGYLALVKFKDQEDPEKAEKVKNGFRQILESKMTDQLEKKEGIKDIKILEETIDGEQAKVKYSVEYGNGEVVEKDQDMVLVDGKWMIDAGK